MRVDVLHLGVDACWRVHIWVYLWMWVLMCKCVRVDVVVLEWACKHGDELYIRALQCHQKYLCRCTFVYIFGSFVCMLMW